MGRLLVFGIFGFIAVAKMPTAWHSVVSAGDHLSVDSVSLATYDVLKLAVMTTFAALVAVRPPSVRASRAPIAFVACTGAIASIVLLQDPAHSGATTAVLAADALTVTACLWQLVAVLALGRCFGILPEARGLVTRGPYRLVRHPVYLGELGACAGLVLAAPSGWNLVCASTFALCQGVRMRLEERALAAEFPRYSDYARTTPRLLPRLWRGASPHPALASATGDSRS
jgi:protein-S-isoprenylcysteine O-methyltransferase Ste14